MQFSQIINYLLYSKLKIYALLLVPTLISILWHYNNNQLPITDAIDYLWPAFHIYGDFSRLSLYDMIHGLYFDRGWRPTIFHLFYLPFLIISNGNLLFAIGCVHTFFTLISTFFLYKIFNEKLNKNISSLCACILAISSSVLFGGSSVPGFSEVAFVPAFLGFIYLLSKKDTFKNKKTYLFFALLIFLLYCIRPVEALIYTILPLLVFFVVEYKRNKISLYQILKVLNICLFGVLMLFTISHFTGVKDLLYTIDPPNSENLFYLLFYILIFSGFILLLSLNLIKKKEFAENIYITKSFLYAIILIVIWWVGFFKNLFEWIYRTSLGDVVSNMVISEASILKHMSNLITDFGYFVFIIILSFFIIKILLFLVNKDIKNIKNIISNYEIIIFSSIPIPLIFYLFSVQTSFRKIAAAAILFLVLILLLSFKNIKKSNLANLSLFLIVFILSYAHVEFIHRDNNSSFKNNYSSVFVGQSFPNPINIDPNPHNVVVDKLDYLKHKYDISHITLPIDELGNPVDPFLLSIMASEKGFGANYPYTSKFEHDLTFLDKYNAALIINPFGRMVKSVEESEKYKKIMLSNKVYERANEFRTLSPNQRYTYFIQYLYSLDILHKYGWKDVECFEINKKFEGCLIIKLHKKE